MCHGRGLQLIASDQIRHIPTSSHHTSTHTYCCAAGDARCCKLLIRGVCRPLEGKREQVKAGKAMHAHSTTCQTLYGGLAELTAGLAHKTEGGGRGGRIREAALLVRNAWLQIMLFS